MPAPWTYKANELLELGISPPLGACQHTRGPGFSTGLVSCASTQPMGPLWVVGLAVEAKGPRKVPPPTGVLMAFPTFEIEYSKV